MYLHGRMASSEHPAHKINDKTNKKSCDMGRIDLHFRGKQLYQHKIKYKAWLGSYAGWKST